MHVVHAKLMIQPKRTAKTASLFRRLARHNEGVSHSSINKPGSTFPWPQDKPVTVPKIGCNEKRRNDYSPSSAPARQPSFVFHRKPSLMIHLRKTVLRRRLQKDVFHVIMHDTELSGRYNLGNRNNTGTVMGDHLATPRYRRMNCQEQRRRVVLTAVAANPPACQTTSINSIPPNKFPRIFLPCR